ncbi:hypothetical protein CL617_02285 [archaeon]|jgi:hypothetical protein|nr:hypothetical protein [archaeon]|tara:strand:+ start:1792 stop:2166 length:375 start_codon:yes stop_codon:yes gene_type:complete
MKKSIYSHHAEYELQDSNKIDQVHSDFNHWINVIELLENNEKAERIMEDLRGTQGPTVNFRYALYHIKNVSFVASRVSTSDAYYQPKVAKGISVLDVFLTGEETNVNDVEEILKKEYIKLERNN